MQFSLIIEGYILKLSTRDTKDNQRTGDKNLFHGLQLHVI